MNSKKGDVGNEKLLFVANRAGLLRQSRSRVARRRRARPNREVVLKALRFSPLITALVCYWCFAPLVSATGSPPPPAGRRASRSVHEWGTFTVLQDENGSPSAASTPTTSPAQLVHHLNGVRSRNMQIWLERFARPAGRRWRDRRSDVLLRRSLRADVGQRRCGRPARARRALVPRLSARCASRHRDADGRCRSTGSSIPKRNIRGTSRQDRRALCRTGYGEIEIHLHHDNDTEANFRTSIARFCKVCTTARRAAARSGHRRADASHSSTATGPGQLARRTGAGAASTTS